MPLRLENKCWEVLRRRPIQTAALHIDSAWGGGATLTLLALFTLPAASAMAQEVVVEEIIVTAHKRAESIQDVPISITAFSGDFLAENGLVSIEDVSRMTPNFSIATSSFATNNRMIIRGIGSVGNSAIESSVGVFIDGVYYPRPGSLIGMLLDVETFEVLRGPQGTLFGRNTVAGALNITTRSPSAETEGIIEFGVGDYDAYELGATYNAALSDSVAARVAFKYVDRGGYGTNTYDGKEFGARDDFVARGKALFDLGDRLSLLLTADYAEINAEGNAVELLNSTRSPVFEATTTALYGSSPVTEDSYDWKIHQVHQDGLKDTQQGISLDINHEYGKGVTLRSITAYREWEADSTNLDIRLPASLAPASTSFRTDTFSQEMQLISSAGNTLDWLAGLYYYQEAYDIDETRSAGDSFCDPTISAISAPAGALCLANEQADAVVIAFSQELESIAFFGQLTWNIGDGLDTTLGLRWSDDRKDGDFDDQVNNPVLLQFHAQETTLGMKRDDSKTTGFANVNWKVSEDIMLFATWSSGYKSGGFNSNGGSQFLGVERRVFAPEETTNYELGVKSKLLDGSMTANATLYRTDLDNFQDRGFDGLSFVVINAGEVRQQGIEVDVKWVPMDPLRVVAGVSYLDSEYLSFEGAPPLPGGTVQDLAGERRNYSPKWQTSLAADWAQGFADGLEWHAGASWSWVDDQNVGAASNNNPQSMQDSVSFIHARAGLRSAAGHWDITLFGNNLTDEDHCQAIFDQAFGEPLGAVDAANHTSVQRCVLGAPRTWNLKASFRF
jgi:iron complex outermembrane receptor protein